MKNLITTIALGLTLSALVACGGDDSKKDGGSSKKKDGDTSAKTDGGSAKSGSKAYNAADHKGSISGTVKLKGDKVAGRELAVAGDKFCEGALTAGKMMNEDYVVNDDMTVPNAVVYLGKGPHDDYKFAVPTDRKLNISQEGCKYIPHVFSVMIDEKFTVSNDDDTTHNVHAKPKRSDKKYNASQAPGAKDEFVFDKDPRGPVPFSCDIHSWMSAHCIVTDHPFVAITDAQGKFEIKGLPAGEYELKFWTPKLSKSMTVKVTVADAAIKQDVELDQK